MEEKQAEHLCESYRRLKILEISLLSCSTNDFIWWCLKLKGFERDMWSSSSCISTFSAARLCCFLKCPMHVAGIDSSLPTKYEEMHEEWFHVWFHAKYEEMHEERFHASEKDSLIDRRLLGGFGQFAIWFHVKMGNLNHCCTFASHFQLPSTSSGGKKKNSARGYW